MYQVALVENFLRRINFKNYQFFGGYEDSERKILIVYPDKYNDSMIEKIIVNAKNFKNRVTRRRIWKIFS